MASFPSYNVFITLAILHVFLISSSAKLSENYYKDSFPQLYETVSKVVQDAIKEERRMGASLLRLHFHDCFVTGCDGSLLLDDTPSFTGEKTARPNNNSARGFEVIDKIKKAVEKVHRGVVSCADILAIAAKASVCILGGPDWKVQLGRKDALTASLVAANNGSIPAPTSNLTALINRFKALGLSKTDLVALSGSHTIGQARCTNFRAHIYNDTDVEASFANERKRNCPGTSGSGDNNLAPLDLQTPNDFDNTYFGNLVNKTGLLHSDQQLFSGNSDINPIVKKYSNNREAFFKDFAKAMVKMGNISPLTGDEGEIRTNCRKVNT